MFRTCVHDPVETKPVWQRTFSTRAAVLGTGSARVRLLHRPDQHSSLSPVWGNGKHLSSLTGNAFHSGPDRLSQNEALLAPLSLALEAHALRLLDFARETFPRSKTPSLCPLTPLHTSWPAGEYTCCFSPAILSHAYSDGKRSRALQIVGVHAQAAVAVRKRGTGLACPGGCSGSCLM